MDRKFDLKIFLVLLVIFFFIGIGVGVRQARADLDEVKKSGQLRHLGIPYANFVTTADYGLSVELMQKFARRLGVEYVYVPTSWAMVFADLTGEKVKVSGSRVEVLERTPVKGDLIANGLTVLDWRCQLVDYSRQATFPTQVWVVARIDSPLRPITPSGSTADDIAQVKEQLKDRVILHKTSTCLDASLYQLQDICRDCLAFPGSLNDLAPAVINGEAEATLLDVPDALVALAKWPGKIKIIGPVSEQQRMGVGFPKSSPRLRAAFDDFFADLQKSGDYELMIKKYYPAVYDFYPDFFKFTPPSVQ
ncbi:MAG: transporter substrate-binding domain-containing protein [Deltaproteobacteria bacterium]|nr:transporter substrate-binding domain-containing protein [Deltaproteobacteria bacterium]